MSNEEREGDIEGHFTREAPPPMTESERKWLPWLSCLMALLRPFAKVYVAVENFVIRNFRRKQ